MAKIHTLPARIGPAAGRHLAAQLSALMAAGVDLGPRHHQIAMIQASIRATRSALPEALAYAMEELPADDPYRREAEQAVQRFVEVVDRLMQATAPGLTGMPGGVSVPAA